MATVINGKEYVTDKEAAELLNINWQVLAQWRSRHKNKLNIDTNTPHIPYLKIGKKIYYEKNEITAFVERSTYTK